MFRLRSIPLALFALFAVSLGSATAQANEDPAGTDLRLSHIRAEHVQLQHLHGLLQKLYGRRVQIRGGKEADNLMLGNGSILVYETEDRIADIRDAAEQLDIAPPKSKDSLTTIAYEPRAKPPGSLQQALQIFTQPNMERAARLTVSLQQNNTLLLRGGTAVVEEAKELLRSIDKPAPQIMLSGFVLIGGDEAGKRAPSPELEQALREVLPYRHYAVHAASVVRISAQSTRRFSIELAGPRDNGDDQRDFTMQGTIGAYDPERTALTLDRLSVHVRPKAGYAVSSLLETSTTVFGDEYAVLGVAGGEPVFVVIRLKPIGKRGKGIGGVVRKSN